MTPTGELIGELLDKLFDSHRKPNGKQYTHSEVSRAIGGQIEASYIGKLRAGKVENPTRQTILLLCQFFSSVGPRVSPSYFFPELAVFDAPEQAETSESIIDIDAVRARGLSEEARQKLAEFLRALKPPRDE